MSLKKMYTVERKNAREMHGGGKTRTCSGYGAMRRRLIIYMEQKNLPPWGERSFCCVLGEREKITFGKVLCMLIYYFVNMAKS